MNNVQWCASKKQTQASQPSMAMPPTTTMMIGKNRVRQRPSTFYWIKWHFRLFSFFFSFFRRQFSFVFVAMEEGRSRFLAFDIRSLKYFRVRCEFFIHLIRLRHCTTIRIGGGAAVSSVRLAPWAFDDNGVTLLLAAGWNKSKTSMGNFHRRITYCVMNFVHESVSVRAGSAFAEAQPLFRDSVAIVYVFFVGYHIFFSRVSHFGFKLQISTTTMTMTESVDVLKNSLFSHVKKAAHFPFG